MNTISRSSKADVRNPLLAIPEVQAEFARLTPDARRALENALRAMSRVFHKKGDEAWAKRKPPIAAYWRASGVNDLARPSEIPVEGDSGDEDDEDDTIEDIKPAEQTPPARSPRMR